MIIHGYSPPSLYSLLERCHVNSEPTVYATRASTRPLTVGTGRAGRNIQFENDYDDLDGAGPSREPAATLPAPAVPSGAVGSSDCSKGN